MKRGVRRRALRDIITVMTIIGKGSSQLITEGKAQQWSSELRQSLLHTVVSMTIDKSLSGKLYLSLRKLMATAKLARHTGFKSIGEGELLDLCISAAITVPCDALPCSAVSVSRLILQVAS